ncbi:bacterioferritin [Hahella sp. CCB-MM4]|uniref:bacterioferritin n=1 Tax=Hahella sp. (strain CCB-MM4) TaxID=1926491 RepID=UPI000B9A43BB|nr:bacterioferritin [Hahella sp. CCB-MM4]OZG71602.1 bacterioferritin [Hahella sp. CCB-MM4]
MKSNDQIITALNGVLTSELTSINRYFLHARMYRNWGFEELNEAAYKKSIKDMKQADDLIERILFLESMPNLQKLDLLHIGENTEEMMECDLKFQLKQIKQLKDAIALCEQEKDFVSRSMLTEILEYEEDYVDWLETQQYQIANMGIQNYLQAQISDGD